MLRLFAAIIIMMTISYGCSDNNNINSAPEITYTGINKDTLRQGSLGIEDTLVVAFSFIDLDGDLCGNPNNIEVIDNRTGELHVTNAIPDLPAANNGNIGNAVLQIPTLCCLFDDKPACSNPEGALNSISFSITVFDAAGNESNMITTQEITIICN